MTPQQKTLIQAAYDQVRFLDVSLVQFAKGRRHEALRLATTLRVLFHQTKHSHSLVNQLRDAFPTRSEGIQMLGTRGGGAAGMESVVFYVGIRHPPWRLEELDDPAVVFDYFRRGVALSDWWQSPVLIFPPASKPWSRRRIVLDLANKLGGAHVDPNVPSELRAALSSFRSVASRGPQTPAEETSLLYLAVSEAALAAIHSVYQYLLYLEHGPERAPWYKPKSKSA